MAVNEEERQRQVAGEMVERAQTLAHSTRNVPNARDAYPVLRDVAESVYALEQVTRQLASWHARAIEGENYDGDGQAAVAAASAALDRAAAALNDAGSALQSAFYATGDVRWRGVDPS